MLGRDGTPALDRHAPGRGAWLCTGNLECCAREAKRRKAYARAFRTPVAGAAIDVFLGLFGSGTPDVADLHAVDGSSVAGNHLKG